MDNETWLPVVGFEGLYEVSNLGRLRSVDRTIVRHNGIEVPVRGQLLRQKTIVSGYPRFVLMKDGKRHNKYLHRLVAEAHVPNPNAKPIVMHKGKDKTDCSASNLRWGDHLANQRQRFDDGTCNSGERNTNAVLSDEDVRAIRLRRANSEALGEIAKDYGVSLTLISLVANGRAWRHVDGPLTRSRSKRIVRKKNG